MLFQADSLKESLFHITQLLIWVFNWKLNIQQIFAVRIIYSYIQSI